MPKTQVKDYRALDAYRFLAAAMVALGHYNEGFKLGLESHTALAVRFSLFVDFFFILSGFVIALNYADRITSSKEYGEFLWRRIARLWPLHFAVILVLCFTGLVGYLTGHKFNNAEILDVKGLPWNVFLLHAWGPVWHYSFNVPSWSISAEMFVYALFPVFAWQARRFPLLANVGGIVAMVVLMAVLRQAAGLKPWHLATYDLGILRAVPSFLLGVLIHRFAMGQALSWKGDWRVAHGVFVLALIAIHLNLPSELVIVLFGAFVFAAIKAEETNPHTWLSGLRWQNMGRASYALYMIHMPMMTFGMVLARKVDGIGGAAGWGFALSVLAAAILLALWLFKGFEDPWRRRLNRMSPFAQSKANKTLTA